MDAARRKTNKCSVVSCRRMACGLSSPMTRQPTITPPSSASFEGKEPPFRPTTCGLPPSCFNTISCYMRGTDTSTTCRKLFASEAFLPICHDIEGINKLVGRGTANDTWRTEEQRTAPLISSHFYPAVLTAWGIQTTKNVGRSTKEQAIFLNFHRNEI